MRRFLTVSVFGSACGPSCRSGTQVLISVACLAFAACLTELDRPLTDSVECLGVACPVSENRGRLLATGVQLYQPPFGLSSHWAWLDNAREIAYVTSTGFVGEGALWYMDVDSRVTNRILDLNVPVAVAYSGSQNRIYVSQWRGLYSVAPDGSDPVLETTDIQAQVTVSPNGRFRAYTTDTTGASILIDTQEWDTIQNPGGWPRRIEDSGHLIYRAQDGVGVLNLSTGDRTDMLSPESIVALDVRGPAWAPELTGVGDRSETPDYRIMIFVGDPSGPGTLSEVYRIPRDSIWGVSNVEFSRSPDGNLLGFGVTRSIHCTFDFTEGTVCWETYVIEVYDISSGVRRVVANGRSDVGAWGLVFSPDGSRLLYETDGNLYLVELGSGTSD